MRLAIGSLLVVALAGQTLPTFTDVTSAAKVRFRHQASKTSRKYLPESVGSGVAMFDFNNDGHLDLYFVNGARLADPMRPGARGDKSDPSFWNRLFRNNGDMTFADATEKSGLRGLTYGMGVAAADYDNDGWTDLFVTGLFENTLYRNRGDGTFEDVTQRAGVKGSGWSTSAAFVDLDGDGSLDLFVARYVEWDFEPDIWCGARRPGFRSYCHPDQFRPISHLLYRNRGDGTFADISKESGVAASPGKGLGVAIHDFNGDGRADIVVANDSWPQQLFRNEGGGKVREIGLDAGIAYDDEGRTYGGMGVDFADYDNDGRPDIFINALAKQRYALYRNTGDAFEYASESTNVGRITRLNSGWGARFLDYDNDGRRDLLVAQGHVMDNIELTQPLLKYREPLLLMRNLGSRFADVSAQSGEPFRGGLVARGMAVGDLDNDGWLDVAVSTNDGDALVLRNSGSPGHHWLIVNFPHIGARVRIITDEGAEQNAFISPAGSYLSSNDPRVHFGLGSAVRLRSVEIQWPGGKVTVLKDIAADWIFRTAMP